MTRDPILFRVDGTTQTGLEHLARCLTYAAALQRRRRPTYFLSQLEPAALGLAIKRAGNDWLEADGPVGSNEDITESIQEIRRLQPAAVVVDSPQASEAYLTELAATGTMVVSIDNQAAIRFPSRLVVNPMLGPGREAYEHSPHTQLLLGARYALVRPEIRRIRPTRSQEPPPLSQAEGKGNKELYRVLIALGDDDPNQQIEPLTRILLNVPRVGRVDVLVRPQHRELAKYQFMAEASNGRLEVSTETADVSARIVRSHFAITTGGVYSLELACVGVPQLVIVQSESHWPTAQRLEEEGCATCLGWHASVSAQTVRQAVQNLLTDPFERQAMARCARKLVDGRGPDRLVTALEVMLHPSRLVDLSEAA
jgi:spore coat polysaccharide biosynthesis predicted glycosyltransferase SpsG